MLSHWIGGHGSGSRWSHKKNHKADYLGTLNLVSYYHKDVTLTELEGEIRMEWYRKLVNYETPAIGSTIPRQFWREWLFFLEDS